MPAESSRLEMGWNGLLTLVSKELARVLRIWPQTLVPPVITTTLYFIIFGPVLGTRIGQMEGFTYVQYVTPGLVMMAIITNAYSNVVSSFFGAKFQRFVEEMLISPMPDAIILLGHVAGGVLRALLVGVLVTGVSLFFTDLPLVHPVTTVLVAVLTATLFSLAGFINALLAKDFDDISVIPTFVLTPLTMLGGVFYSVDLLPDLWAKVSHANPVLYMVNAFRFGILGASDIPIGVAWLVLLLFTAALFLTALAMLARGVGIRA